MGSNKAVLAPLVSVVIPGYKSRYILETIDSILHQSYPEIEIIVIDDGSPNNLPEVLSPLITDNKINYIYQTNQKMAAARNNGIKNAKGQFIAFIDDDDLWTIDKIEKQLALFEDKNVGLVYSFTEGFNEQGAVAIPNFEKEIRGSIYKDIFLQDFISNSSVMVRKSCFDSLGVFNTSPQYFGVDDCDMWSRISYHYQADVVPEKLTRIRLHSEQFSIDRSIMVENDIFVRRNLIKELDIPAYYSRKYFQRIYFDLGYGLRKKNKIMTAKYYLKSFFSFPSFKQVKALIKLPFN